MAPTEDANCRLTVNWDGEDICSSPSTDKDGVKSPLRVPLDSSSIFQDLDNTCEIYFCGWNSDLASNNTPVRHLTVPQASPDFRKAMVTAEPLEVPKLSRSPSPSIPALSSKSQSLTSPRQHTHSSSPSSPIPRSTSSTPSSVFSSPLPPSLSPSSNSKPTLAAALSLVLSPLNPESKPKKPKAKLWQDPVFLPSIETPLDLDTTPSGMSSSRRPASFGDADRVRYIQVQGRRASHGEKHVSWADEFGSTSKLTSVRLIRPRLDASDSSKKSGAPVPTPGRSILRETGAK